MVVAIRKVELNINSTAMIYSLLRTLSGEILILTPGNGGVEVAEE